MALEFVRVQDASGAKFSQRDIAPRDGVTVLDEPATRPDGTPLPPEYPTKKKAGQKADTDKES